jgi:hypothetical protein
MPSINLDLDYFNHPKTQRLVGLLGRGAEVLPIRLWTYCGKYHSEDGSLTGYTDQEIEAICGWWGPYGKMIAAMLECGNHLKSKRGFIYRADEGLFVHDWKIHAGHIEAYKRKAAIMVEARLKKVASLPNGETPKTTSSELPCSTSSQLPCPTRARQGKAGQGKADNKQQRSRALTFDPEGTLDLPEALKANEPDIRQWLKYKRERGQGYKPTGFNTLVNQLAQHQAAGQDVAAMIQRSIANNWAGIFPDKSTAAIATTKTPHGKEWLEE